MKTFISFKLPVPSHKTGGILHLISPREYQAEDDLFVGSQAETL